MTRLIAPHYYPFFRCIADQCRHSCCIGWEIDVDPDTRERYRHVPGPFGARLNAAIEDGEEVSSFRLSPEERCPMLNASGLCDLITALGEDALCQICADHPRFRNYFSCRVEVGLGLCCEEAARLILSQEEPMTLIALEDDDDAEDPADEELDLLHARAQAIALMQDDAPLPQRLAAVLRLGGRAIPDLDWVQTFRALERLDPAWDAALDRLTGLSADPPVHLTRALMNFCVYLLYRHLPGALEDDDLPGRMAFCVLSTRVLASLCAATPDCTLTDCIEYARMYSAEIEYSEDNINALLDALWEDSLQ